MESADNDAGNVRCPTCRAVQEWSDTCRRCKSDLTLLRATDASWSQSRRDCLRAIRDGRPRDALRSARQMHALRPDGESARLLALTSALNGHWNDAEALARAAAD